MALNYRVTDPHKVGSDVMKDRSRELEERAYSVEMEVKRLEVIQPIDSDNGEVADLLRKARHDAPSARGKARRAAGASPLDVEDVIEIREGFLNRWLKDVEENHAKATAFLADAERQLDLDGEDEVTGRDRRELEEIVPKIELDIAMLEATHKLVTSSIDSLHDHPDRPEDPPEPEAPKAVEPDGDTPESPAMEKAPEDNGAGTPEALASLVE